MLTSIPKGDLRDVSFLFCPQGPPPLGGPTGHKAPSGVLWEGDCEEKSRKKTKNYSSLEEESYRRS